MAPKKEKEEDKTAGAARFGRVRNSLKMGIVGLPNVGKSSLFNLLTGESISRVACTSDAERAPAASEGLSCLHCGRGYCHPIPHNEPHIEEWGE